MLRERLPTPSPPLLSVPNRRYSYLRCALGRPLETRRVAGRLAPQPAAAGLVHNSARRVLDPGRTRLFSRLFPRKNPGLFLLPGLVSGSSLR